MQKKLFSRFIFHIPKISNVIKWRKLKRKSCFAPENLKNVENPSMFCKLSFFLLLRQQLDVCYTYLAGEHLLLKLNLKILLNISCSTSSVIKAKRDAPFKSLNPQSNSETSNKNFCYHCKVLLWECLLFGSSRKFNNIETTYRIKSRRFLTHLTIQ